MEHLDVAAFVLTTPYYEVDTAQQVMKYFREVAKSTSHNIMLYDLAAVTNFKITYDLAKGTTYYFGLPAQEGYSQSHRHQVR